MTIERLVQEYRIETNIFVAAEGSENSASEQQSGADIKVPDDRTDASLKGRITVSADVDDDDRAAEVCLAFAEFGAEDVAAS